ncbi:zinc knuckle CX2CX4HX4C containing protein [Tanacetum coccineum]
MAGVDNNTITMDQYLALTQGNQLPGMVKPEIKCNVNFEIKSQFMRELWEDTFSRNKNEMPMNILSESLIYYTNMADHAQKWHDRTSSKSIGSSNNTNVLAVIVSKLDNLGRNLKKLKENVHAIQVGCQICKGPHLDKEYPFNEEVKGGRRAQKEDENPTEVIQCQLPYKEPNPGSLTLPCTINNLNFYAMADLRASVNVMPKGIFEYMKLTNLRKTNMPVKMADMTKKALLWVIENILVKVD